MLGKLKAFSLAALLYGCGSAVNNAPVTIRPIRNLQEQRQPELGAKLRNESIHWWGFTIRQGEFAYTLDTRTMTPMCKLELDDDAILHDYQCDRRVDSISDDQGIYTCSDSSDIRCARANGILYDKMRLLNVRKTLMDWITLGGYDVLRNYE